MTEEFGTLDNKKLDELAQKIDRDLKFTLSFGWGASSLVRLT